MLPEPQVLSIIAGMQEFVAKRQNSLTGKFEFKKTATEPKNGS